MRVIRLIALYVLAIVGIFVEFDFLNSLGNIAYKIGLAAVISYLIFELGKEKIPLFKIKKTPETPEPIAEESRSQQNVEKFDLFFDIAPTEIIQLFQDGQRYLDFLSRQFFVMWNFILPQNGYLFYKSKDNQLRLIHKQIKRGINWDWNSHELPIIPLIEQKDGILIENNLDASAKLLPFYNPDEFCPLSVLAMATDFDSGERLFWIFDANSTGCFNSEESDVLQAININTRTAVLEALYDNRLLSTLSLMKAKSDIANLLNTARDQSECFDIFSDFLIQEFEASKLTIALRKDKYLESNSAVIEKSIGIDDSFRRGYEFTLDEGLNGWVIQKNKPYVLDDIERGEYFVPRFSKNEKSNFGLRSFLSVPVQIELQALGMITLEDKEPNKYSDDDKKKLTEYSNMLAFAMQRFR